MRTLYERLAYDGDADFLRIANAYLRDDSNDYVRHLKKQFALVANEDPRYLNHEEVLAISVGGSNTKVMMAKTENGFLKVSHIQAIKNPKEKTHFYDFLDRLLVDDKVVYAYLTKKEKPVVCVVLPVMIGEDGIPQHPKKIPTIDGMLARNEADMVPEMNLENNLKRYFESRNIPLPKIFYQPDPPVAHIGGLSQLVSYKENQKTFLMVCGTGMATADDNVSRTISRTQIMDFDEGLYPCEETEGYLYESGCSGLLVYGVMKRAIQIRAKEEGSALAGTNAADYFVDSDDSELVTRLWESTFDLDIKNKKVLEMKQNLSKEAFEELQIIASLMMKRLHGTIANAILATAIKINQQEGFSPYHVIFEGSVALNPYSRGLIFQEISERLKKASLFGSMNVDVPELDLIFRDRKEILFDESVSEEARKKVDISLIGTVIIGITSDIVND